MRRRALLVLSTTFGEYTLSAFIVGDAWKTSGVWMYTLWDSHPHETVALGIVTFAVTWCASLAILAIFGRRSLRGRTRLTWSRSGPR